jgi:putative spermidine/putrescine transport system permease protein
MTSLAVAGPATHRRAGRLGPFLLIGPLVLVFFTILILPLGLMLSSAFQRISLSTYQVVDRLTLYQFVRFFGDRYYLELVLQTLDIAGQTTLFCLLIGYPFALHMWRSGARECRILRLIVLSPLLISFVVLNFGWLIILAPQGVANSLVIWLGLAERPLSLLYTKGAVIVGLVHIHLPFMILSIENGLETIRPEVVRAAASLGASPARQFLHVILPLSISGVASGCLIVFATTASAFVTPVLLGGAWVKTLASVAYQQIMVNLDIPFGSAISIILLLLTGALTFLLVRVTAWLQPQLADAQRIRT